MALLVAAEAIEKTIKTSPLRFRPCTFTGSLYYGDSDDGDAYIIIMPPLTVDPHVELPA